jgi:hypothetical protein
MVSFSCLWFLIVKYNVCMIKECANLYNKTINMISSSRIFYHLA